MTVLAVFFWNTLWISETEKGKKKSFPEVLIKVFGLYFLLPRTSSVEKGASIFLRFSLWDGAERQGAQEPPAETWASGRSGSEQPLWLCLAGVWALKGRAGGETRGPFPPESQITWLLTVAGRWEQAFISAVLGRSARLEKLRFPEPWGHCTADTPLSSVAHLGGSIRTKDEIRKIQDVIAGKTPLFLFPFSGTFCICPLPPCWVNLPFEAVLATNYLAKIFLFFLSFEQWWHVQVQLHQTLLSVNEIYQFIGYFDPKAAFPNSSDYSWCW